MMSNSASKIGSGAATRLKLLDAAEQLFALDGFGGVAIRDVTGVAGVSLALANYHFGTKEKLLEEVVARRASWLAARRLTLLEAALARDAAYEALLEAFITPYLEMSAENDTGLRNYCRVLRNIVASSRWTSLAAIYFDPVAKRYVDALTNAIPRAPRERIAKAFSFCIALMVSVYGDPQRAQTFASVNHRSGWVDEHRDLLEFIVAGFRPLVEKPPKRVTARRISR